MLETIWWCLKAMGRAGLPPLLLALALSAALRWLKPRTAAPRPAHLVWATLALALYLIASKWWWDFSYPGLNEAGGWPARFDNRLARWGAIIGIAWGLFRLVASNWRVFRGAKQRGFEVIQPQTLTPVERTEQRSKKFQKNV